MKVLIVDDSKFAQMHASKVLKSIKPDLEVSCAGDGREGFCIYQAFKPDFILVDLLMPGINGQELVKWIQKYDERAKIFVVSADIQRSVKEELESFGILKFFNKPMDEEKARELLRLVEGD